MIDEAFCPLNTMTFWNDDFRSCGQLLVFSGSATNPAYYGWAGYGDVDDCTDGRFQWIFDFNI